MALNAADLPGLIANEVKKHLDPFEALMKQLEAPAQRAGLSPIDYMHKMTQGGKQDGTFGPDGSWAPFNAHALPFQRKSLGWGPLWSDLAAVANPNSGLEAINKAKTRLDGPIEKGGYGGSWVPVEKAALAESSGITGGYTVPPEMSKQLLTIAAENQVFAPKCSKMPIAAKSITVPSLDLTGTTAGRSPFLGGLVATWHAEAQSRDESEPTFRQTELTAWELSFYTLASNTLLADNAVALDSFLTTLFSMAIDWYTEYAFLRGDGVGKPLGVLSCPALVSITRGTTARIRWVDVATMESRLLAASADRAIYLAHQSIKPDLFQMHDSQGNQTAYGAGRPVFISSDGGMSKKLPDTLVGRPIYYSEKLPVLGTAGDLLLVDPFFYLLGTRMEIEIAVSAHAAFRTNQMAWRIVWRGDGRPWLANSITLADGSHTVSPFVAIAA